MVLKPTTGIILSFMLTGGVQASTEHHPIPSSHYYDHDDHAKIHHDALSLQETTIGNRNQACTNSSNNNTLTNSRTCSCVGACACSSNFCPYTCGFCNNDSESCSCIGTCACSNSHANTCACCTSSSSSNCACCTSSHVDTHACTGTPISKIKFY